MMSLVTDISWCDKKVGSAFLQAYSYISFFNKRKFFIFLLFPIILFSVYIPNAHTDEIVAVVNDDVILRSELDKAYNSIFVPRGVDKPDERQLLEELVTRKIQLDLAKKFGVFVGEDEVEEYIQGILKQNGLNKRQQEKRLIDIGSDYQEWRREIADSLVIRRFQMQQLRSYVKVSESEINSFLISNTPSQLLGSSYDLAYILIDATDTSVEQVEVYTSGLISAQSSDEVKALVAEWDNKELQVNIFSSRSLGSLPDLFRPKVMLKNKGDAFHFFADGFWHILKVLNVKHAEGLARQELKISIISLLNNIIYTNKQLEVRINSIYQKLELGEDFNELASIYSDPSSSLQKYTLSWTPTDSLPLLLKNKLIKITKNQFTKPFNSEDGWHIVLLEDKRENDITIQQFKDLTFQRLANRKLGLTLPFWINDILSRSYVEYRI